MFHRLLKSVSLVTSAALVGALLTVASFVTPPSAVDDAAQAAPPASSFDPGLIISDAVMFDFGAMSLGDIQSFLDSKVTTCDPAASAPCLKDYHADTHDIAAVANRCTGNITGAANQSAAQIIYAVSRACEVNPKVLIVTLQKEQGLVTSTSPTAGKYKIAMGYGCPDTAPCDSDYFGFFNQMYQAAYAFNKYTKSPDQYTAYQPGTRKVAYNPKSSCGSATVDIKTKATGALYFYTPYVPNEAALSNPYGVGDSCSSYGNRNFWVYFNDWFGSAIGGSFIVDTADGHTFVLINGQKWEVPASRAGLLKTLAPLGTVGRVSTAYVNSFPGTGVFGNLVTDTAGHVWVLDNGRKYSLADCAQASDYGFSCDFAPQLTDDMLNLFSSTGQLNSYVATSSGATFVLGGTVKRELLDIPSAAAAGLSLPVPNSLLDDTLSSIAYGAPIVRSDALVALRGTSDVYIFSGSNAYKVSAALLTQTSLSTDLGGTAGSLDAASFAFLPAATPFNGLLADTSSGRAFVLTKTGAALVTDPKEWGATFVPVDSSLSSKLTVSASSYSAPLFVKDLTTSKRYLIKAGKQQPIASTKQMKALAKATGAKNTAVSLSGATVPVLGKPLLKAGSLAKSSKKSTKLWLIDGTFKKRSITASQAKEITGSTKATVVAAVTLDGYTTVKGAAKPGLKSAGKYYVADKGVLREITAADAKRYGSKYGFGSYDATTIAALGHGAAIGRVIKYGSKYYEVKNGKKVHISTAAAKKIVKSTGKKIQPVSKYLASLLPTR